MFVTVNSRYKHTIRSEGESLIGKLCLYPRSFFSHLVWWDGGVYAYSEYMLIPVTGLYRHTEPVRHTTKAYIYFWPDMLVTRVNPRQLRLFYACIGGLLLAIWY